MTAEPMGAPAAFEPPKEAAEPAGADGQLFTALQTLLSWGRLYTANVKPFFENGMVVIRDLNRKGAEQVIFTKKFEPMTWELQLQALRDSIVATKILEHFQKVRAAAEKENEAS